jgi:hypothetical protein
MMNLRFKRVINIGMAKEADDVKPGNKSGCPQDKGLPGCACANDIDGVLGQII